MDAMLAEMTSAQFTDWIAYYEVEPFGRPREDLRAAVIASAIINAAGGIQGKAIAPQQIFPDTLDPDWRPLTEQSAVEITLQLDVMRSRAKIAPQRRAKRG